MLIPVRSGLCTSFQLGGFITTLPENTHLNDTSIYTTPLKFSTSSFPTTTPVAEEPIPESTGDQDEEEGEILEEEALSSDNEEKKRQWDLIEGITNGVTGVSADSDSEIGDEDGADGGAQEQGSGDGGGGTAVYEVPVYTGAVHCKVPKTGYYCVGMSASSSSSSSAPSPSCPPLSPPLLHPVLRRTHKVPL